jgi:hypothetical protein
MIAIATYANVFGIINIPTNGATCTNKITGT